MSVTRMKAGNVAFCSSLVIHIQYNSTFDQAVKKQNCSASTALTKPWSVNYKVLIRSVQWEKNGFVLWKSYLTKALKVTFQI